MRARSKIRGALTTSFIVVTTSAIVACTGDPTPKAPEPETTHNPPMPTTTESAQPTTAPTGASTLKPAPTTGGQLIKRPDGTCTWMVDVHCPPREEATCNPPPPVEVRCP